MATNGEATGQTGTLGAARMARDAGVGDLVLTHIGPSISAGIRQTELAVMAAIHRGNIRQAVEGWSFGV